MSREKKPKNGSAARRRDGQPKPRQELERLYGAIGISAVAAAARYHDETGKRARTPGRSGDRDPAEGPTHTLSRT